MSLSGLRVLTHQFIPYGQVLRVGDILYVGPDRRSHWWERLIWRHRYLEHACQRNLRRIRKAINKGASGGH